MSTQIAIEKVDVPPKWRKAKKSAVAQLGDSLAREGLLHPIGVCPNEDVGRWTLVYGRHRLEAAKKIGWTEIDATILPVGRTSSFYASCTGAENLFRSELTAAERVLALKRWHESYAEEFPETVGQAARSRAGHAARWGKEEEGEQTSPDAPAPKTFTQHVAEVTGQPLKSVQRYLYSGKALSEEQLLVLAQANVPHNVVKEINKLAPDKAAAAVALIAAGVGAKEAIAEATLPPGATMEVVGNPEDPKPEEELTDEEWVAQECGEVLERLKYKVAYIADAVVYRRIREARAKLRNVAKKPLAQAQRVAVGPFQVMLSRFLNTDHPKNWLPCGPCGATGMSGSESKCGTCYGSGYVLRKEMR